MAAGRMDLLSVACCFLAVLCGSRGKEYVPVLTWQSCGAPADAGTSALKHLSSEQFADVLQHRMAQCSHKPKVLFFTEENLSLEDFRGGEFPHIRNASAASAVFMPSVEAPLGAARGLGARVEELDDAHDDEDRPELLRRHDARVGDAYRRLAGQGPVLAVYTGRHASWTAPEPPRRTRRLLATDNGAPNNSSALVLRASSILMYAKARPMLNESGRVSLLDLKQATQQSKATYQSLTAKFTTNGTEQGSVEFFFYNTTGYWALVNVTYLYVSDVKARWVLRPTEGMEAPVGFSYHCTAQTVFRANGTTLTFNNFQAQAFMKNPKVFGDAYNCEMFFTAPIWSGLFVTALLGLIMIWGLVMIMDIRTMDQFDDPKGKTITISATE